MESRGQGIANILSPLLGGMAGCAMIGQSIINVTSGARGRLSTLWSGLFLLFLILVLQDWVARIPMAALVAEPRCSLLVGPVPGKGDPMAYPRVALYCRASMIAPGTAEADAAKTRYLAKNPKAVEAFVKTSVNALTYTFKNVDEAARAASKHTETPLATLKEQLTLAIELMDTAEAKQAGYGVMTPAKWASTQKLQVEYGGQKEAVPDATLWTNKFVK